MYKTQYTLKKQFYKKNSSPDFVARNTDGKKQRNKQQWLKLQQRIMVQTHLTFHPYSSFWFSIWRENVFLEPKNKKKKAKPWMNLTSTRPGPISPQNQNFLHKENLDYLLYAKKQQQKKKTH